MWKRSWTDIPINLAVTACRGGCIISLEDLVLSGQACRPVNFDPDGFGAGRLWPWLKADTAILVWDPGRTGQITSGRQLFGNVTWWMFRENGYDPLAALDNDRDGWLTGVELEGISVWQDRNGNGVSEPGEVVPAVEFGISGIAVKPETSGAGGLSGRNGIRRKSGAVLRSSEWVPVAELPDQRGFSTFKRYGPAREAKMRGGGEQVAVIAPDFVFPGFEGRNQMKGVAGAQENRGGGGSYQRACAAE